MQLADGDVVTDRSCLPLDDDLLQAAILYVSHQDIYFHMEL